MSLCGPSYKSQIIVSKTFLLAVIGVDVMSLEKNNFLLSLNEVEVSK